MIDSNKEILPIERFEHLVKGLFSPLVNYSDTILNAFVILHTSCFGDLSLSDEAQKEGFSVHLRLLDNGGRKKEAKASGQFSDYYLHANFALTDLGSFCESHLKLMDSNNRLTYKSSLSKEYIEYVISNFSTPSDYSAAGKVLIDYFHKFYRNDFIKGGHSICPEELIELFKNLVPSKEGSSVFNPFSGMGSLSAILPKGCNYYGQELSSESVNIARFLLPYISVSNNRIEACDSITNWPKQKYDLIVSIPPFNIKLNGYDDVIQRYKTVENWLFENAANSLTADGRAIFLVSSSALYRRGLKKVVDELIMRNMLDLVIMLPSGVWSGTSISTSIVVLRNGRNIDDPIRLVDASEMYISKKPLLLNIDAIKSALDSVDGKNSFSITRDAIIKRGCQTNPRAYKYPEESIPSGYALVPVSSIMRKYRGSSKQYNNFQSFGSGNLMWYPFEDLCGIIKDNETGKSNRGIIADEPILVSSCAVGGHFLASYVEASPENPVLIDDMSFGVFSVDTSTIDVQYLALKLDQEAEKLWNIYGRQMQVRLNPNDLLSCNIVIAPSLDQQRLYVKDVVSQYKMAKAKELGLESLIAQMKQDYIMEVRNRKHDMKTPMTQLRNTLPLLQSLSKSLPEAAAEKLNIYIQRQKKALDVLSSIVQHIADEEVFSDPEPVEIEPILKQYEEENDRYCVVYDRDEASFEESGIENPIINIGKVEFQRLVQNIIGNVIEHGFVDAENEGYGIHITLGIEDDNYVICFENNGEPFPDGMTKERYGTKGVKGKDSKGSGTGGYLVKSISQHYGGDFDIYTTAFAGFFNCGVIVKFPIYRNEQV